LRAAIQSTVAVVVILCNYHIFDRNYFTFLGIDRTVLMLAEKKAGSVFF